jgi:purine-binding chemotaxis protein CheW
MAAADDKQFVTLCLGAEVFAVPVSYVREILDYRDAFRIPDGPAYFVGLIDVRGRGTPVIDMRQKLGLTPTVPGPATRIMVLDIPLHDRLLPLGLIADRVLEVANFADAEVEAAPDVGVAWRSDYIAGVVRRDSGFVVLFDLPKLLTTDAAFLSATSSTKAA